MPQKYSMRVAGAGLGYCRWRLLHIAGLKLVRPMNLIHRKNQPASFPVCNQQTIVTRANCFPRRLLQAEQTAERNTDQQFSPNVYQSRHDSLALVRKRMRAAPLGY